mgnify:CR=1 FL=1
MIDLGSTQYYSGEEASGACAESSCREILFVVLECAYACYVDVVGWYALFLQLYAVALP